MPERPPEVELADDPVATLVGENERTGVWPGYATAMAGHKADEDVPVDVCVRAYDALDVGG